MKKILVTGGPVHAHIDSVKVVTNGFKGGLMSKLAVEFANAGNEVVYLTSELLKDSGSSLMGNLVRVEYHKGIHDYMDKVLAMAPQMDVVVLGAAVANLIPVCFHKTVDTGIGEMEAVTALPLAGKFPSHNYKPGDIIKMDWTIAPRIIDRVREAAPKTVLVGFKLLDGVTHNELIEAAWGVVTESRADVVFANEKRNLNTVYAVTKERAVNKMDRGGIAKWVVAMMGDTHYKTKRVCSVFPFDDVKADAADAMALLEKNSGNFTRAGDYLFGSIGIRAGRTCGFYTTVRGKNEASSVVWVVGVDHGNMVVSVDSPDKASLNAPLMDFIFSQFPSVHHIVHLHKEDDSLGFTLPYAPPGTGRDSIRLELLGKSPRSFNICGHGVFYLFDQNERMLP